MSLARRLARLEQAIDAETAPAVEKPPLDWPALEREVEGMFLIQDRPRLDTPFAEVRRNMAERMRGYRDMGHVISEADIDEAAAAVCKLSPAEYQALIDASSVAADIQRTRADVLKERGET